MMVVMWLLLLFMLINGFVVLIMHVLFFSLFSFSLTGGERGRREMRIVDTLSLPRLLLYSNIVEGISLGHTFISSVIVRYSNQV